jgi:hypothetical protein
MPLIADNTDIQTLVHHNVELPSNFSRSTLRAIFLGACSAGPTALPLKFLYCQKIIKSTEIFACRYSEHSITFCSSSGINRPLPVLVRRPLKSPPLTSFTKKPALYPVRSAMGDLIRHSAAGFSLLVTNLNKAHRGHWNFNEKTTTHATLPSHLDVPIRHHRG